MYWPRDITNEEILAELAAAQDAVNLARGVVGLSRTMKNNAKETYEKHDFRYSNLNSILFCTGEMDEGLEEDFFQCEAMLANAEDVLKKAETTLNDAEKTLEQAKLRHRELKKHIDELKQKGEWERREKVERARPPPSRTAVDWIEECQAAFADKTTMQTFPQPPSCPSFLHEDSCERSSDFCACAVRFAFHDIGDIDYKVVRNAFHPDRFSACPEEHREEFKQMAHVVFVVADAMLKETQ